jgi:hypothetical protein
MEAMKCNPDNFSCQPSFLTDSQQQQKNLGKSLYTTWHSGSSLDIKFFLFLYFVLIVSFNLSDDVFKKKKKYFSHKMGKIGPWRS